MDNIEELLNGHFPPYVYNKKQFVEGKTPIYYSGPYWDEKEIKAAVDTFLHGKWITAGERVYKFERAFSNRFNVKHSHMVNSGSSANLVMFTALKKFYKWQDGAELIVSPVGFPTTIAPYRDWETDRKSTRLNSSHLKLSRMPSSA